MDLETEILKEHSKRQTIRIAGWVGSDEGRFRELMKLFLHGEPVVTQRTAWILMWCHERSPGLFDPWLSSMLKRMQEPGVHEAARRNVLNILRRREIPPRLLGKVVSICFDYLDAPDTPVAIRVYSMAILANVAKKKPEIQHELRETIEHALPYASGAVHAHARKVFHQLDRSKRKIK